MPGRIIAAITLCSEAIGSINHRFQQPPSLRRQVRLGEDVSLFGFPLAGLWHRAATLRSEISTALTGIKDDMTHQMPRRLRLRVFLPCSQSRSEWKRDTHESDQEWGHSFARAPARSPPVRVAFSSHKLTLPAGSPTMPFIDALRSSIERAR